MLPKYHKKYCLHFKRNSILFLRTKQKVIFVLTNLYGHGPNVIILSHTVLTSIYCCFFSCSPSLYHQQFTRLFLFLFGTITEIKTYNFEIATTGYQVLIRLHLRDSAYFVSELSKTVTAGWR